LKPRERTTNIQAGTTWVGQGLTVSADAYEINFSNEIASHTINNQKQFYNLGTVKYKGVELKPGRDTQARSRYRNCHVGARSGKHR
jgi:outer membrane receptor protein involved in Fe transport